MFFRFKVIEENRIKELAKEVSKKAISERENEVLARKFFKNVFKEPEENNWEYKFASISIVVIGVVACVYRIWVYP